MEPITLISWLNIIGGFCAFTAGVLGLIYG